MARRGGRRFGAGRRVVGKAMRFRAGPAVHADVARFASYRQLTVSEWLRTMCDRALEWEREQERLRCAVKEM